MRDEAWGGGGAEYSATKKEIGPSRRVPLLHQAGWAGVRVSLESHMAGWGEAADSSATSGSPGRAGLVGPGRAPARNGK